MNVILKMRIVFTFAIGILSVLGICAQNAESVLKSTLASLNSKNGISCNFVLQVDGGTTNGSIFTDGEKFVIESSAGSTWFDGKNMWTSNPSTKEITLVIPTADEIAEVNPLSYLKANPAGFKIAYSKRKDVNNYLVVLNPKVRKSQVKAIEIGISKKTNLPSHIIVRDANDNRSTIKISNLKTITNSSQSKFKCPADKMSGYELVDLR